MTKIKVDLSQFFDDERKMCCIFMDPTWKTVECLQKRVEHLFNISSVCFLSDGCFLPSKESIEIIKYCNIIRAFVPKETQEIRKKKKSKKIKESLEQSKSDDNLPETNYIAKDGVNNDVVTSTLDTITASQTSFRSSDDCNTEASLSGSKITKTSSKKRKSSVNEEVMTTSRLSKIASSTLLTESASAQELTHIKNPFKKHKSLQAHLYFDESGVVVSPKSKTDSKKSAMKKDKEQETIVVFRCPLNEVANSDSQTRKPRIFHLKSKNITKKPIVEIQEDILLPACITQNSSLISEATITNIIGNGISAEISCKENKTFNKSLNAKHDKSDDELQNEGKNKSNNKSDENESMVCKEISEVFESGDKNDISEICEPGNETRNDLSTDHNISEIENKSEIADNATESQIELTMEGEDSIQTNEKSKIEEQSSELMNETKIDQTNLNETSIMSVDCVDSETEDKSNDTIQEKHDLTAGDESNISSASDVEEVSEIIDLNESELNNSSSSNSSIEQNNSSNKMKVNKILPFSTDLISLPSVEDTILFKLPYSNKSKKLTTNYIVGKVEYANKRTKMIKVLILDGFAELRHVPNNFIRNLDDSQEDVTQLQLKLNDMVEPKLFSTS